MWELLIKIGVATVLSLSALMLAGKLINKEIKINLKSIAWLIGLIIATVGPYGIEYKMIATVITYFLTIFSIKRIYNVGFNKAVMTATITLTLIAGTDIIVSSILMELLSFEEMRSPDMMIISNLIVITIAFLVFKIRRIKEKLKDFIDKFEASEYTSKLIFCALVFLILIIFFCSVIPQGITNVNYFMNVTIIVVFIILNMMYIEEQNNYYRLMNEYDILYECVQNFEEWIDEEQMSTHEEKNSLASLLDLTEIDQIKDKIKELLEDQVEIEEKWIEQLKYVPKGGIKGILYYKLSLAKQNGIEVVSDVSKQVEPLIKALSENERKELSRLVGIYFDNAIDAAKETKKGKIALELYAIKEDLVFVFSNNYKGTIQLETMNQKGVTSKGKGHGNGLYFASKILGRNEPFIGEQRVINNYYIQKLTIKKYQKKKILGRHS